PEPVERQRVRAHALDDRLRSARVQRDHADPQAKPPRLPGGGRQRPEPVEGTGMIHPERRVARALRLARGGGDDLGLDVGGDSESPAHMSSLFREGLLERLAQIEHAEAVALAQRLLALATLLARLEPPSAASARAASATVSPSGSPSKAARRGRTASPPGRLPTFTSDSEASHFTPEASDPLPRASSWTSTGTVMLGLSMSPSALA